MFSHLPQFILKTGISKTRSKHICSKKRYCKTSTVILRSQRCNNRSNCQSTYFAMEQSRQNVRAQAVHWQIHWSH